MKVTNFGCFGPEGLEVALDEIVCLVGANNTGKSTALRAYEAAVTTVSLVPDDIYAKANGEPATVELWVHIPKDAENIDAKWKEPTDGLLLVRSKWTWPPDGGKPTRTTWDPESSEYAEDGKAAGLDTVFNSRLPKPFRIGSLAGPEEEHKKLLEIIIEPIKTRLADLMRDEKSQLSAKIKAVQAEAEVPVAAFREMIEDAQGKVDTSYKRVFSTASVQINVSLDDLRVDPSAALVRTSRVDVVESHGPTRWSQQGTGSQRALFWSMLEVRSELNRIADERKARKKLVVDKEKELKKKQGEHDKAKKDSTKAEKATEIAAIKEQIAALKSSGKPTETTPTAPFLPGYMLLIDEPETALHPSVVRAAKDHLYSLASESGWQVMLSTHHPAFVDPLKDHTTIVRLHRPDAHAAPNVYRADDMAFQGDEKENLKKLLAFDQSVAEMFFSAKVVIVEGDTELAAFTVAMDADPRAFPIDERPLLLRARGKWTIPPLVRMLAHFKLDCAVLHDVDAPRTSGGGRSNGAYTANAEISTAIDEARKSGVSIIHRCSVPDFERQHGMDLPTKDKPFEAWKAVKTTPTVLASVRSVLDELNAVPDTSAATHADDGQHFEVKCKEWATANAPKDPAFSFGSP